ncbi:MAG: hypothetical protein M3387_02275 [Actinomycetota bacterium]|nr:hypothetical protein [Actinomycetota bacterium]
MLKRHNVTVTAANEALADLDALLFDPDPKSNSGISARVIGVFAISGGGAGRHSRASRRGRMVGRNCVAGQRDGSANLPRGAIVSRAREVVERVAAEAEATRDERMPATAQPTRPNRQTKTVPVAVRLTPEDAAAIEALANRLDVPVSSLVRGWIRSGLAVGREESVATAIARLETDLQRLREMVS